MDSKDARRPSLTSALKRKSVDGVYHSMVVDQSFDFSKRRLPEIANSLKRPVSLMLWRKDSLHFFPLSALYKYMPHKLSSRS